MKFQTLAMALLLSGSVVAAATPSLAQAIEQDPHAHADQQVAAWAELRSAPRIELGPRPLWLADGLEEGPLKRSLQACDTSNIQPSTFSIGHRGAPLQFPEHTLESYVAAARMGAGVIECDVAFTRDRQLVCRHAQDDLHTTTNIVAVPALNAKCTQPFVPADPDSGRPAQAECRTSDITLAEFKTLQGKMDAFDPTATTPQAYLGGTADWRTDLYAARGTVLSHRESIALFKQLGVKFVPELKTPVVSMPFEGEYTQEDYARQMIQDYIDAGVEPADVMPQSFRLRDVLFWIDQFPAFGRQAVYLDDRALTDESASLDYMTDLKAQGVAILAPALWKLLSLDDQQRIVPSEYARNARRAGLDLIAWSVERSGPLAQGGGWYYQSVQEAISRDSDVLTVIDVLAQQVGVKAIFADWPATTSFYAHCMNMNQPDLRLQTDD
ncbi:glycerophosphodiester phosphodiesterase family protein [Halopseudomonas pelagia]|uniref:glycerophosphodiester phosphodiesterase n=1 Tax=Halopseudomonas pelagia TaxID=553151 RepID=A0AA91U3K5_9GAMM|nr:glycerophosphodiester phosphodiesterase family protein [Halopseudomonas pelagia]PCC99356.1 glycerophosphodiester phosphodiesterase [Halopseudomonas pelagia]QFY55455.1 glycerophosphodiester phosphodiesterase [Halopseudomonas pelagia]